MRYSASVALLGVLLPCAAGALPAQQPRLLPEQFVGRDTVRIPADSTHAAGGLFRFFFGRHYRDLWTAPVKVPVLDLQRFDGGLTVTEAGGGRQTRNIEFKSANGRDWVFRSVSKDLRSIIPERLRESFIVSLVNDQPSHTHPGGALVIPPLAEALGVLHVRPQLAIMPDSPALGEHRKEFAGMVGHIEESPNDGGEDRPGFAGSREVVGTKDLIEALNQDPGVRVDAEALLTARLLDFVVNDWDRHRGNWRWARLERGGVERWVPIPRDRDQALLWYDGFLSSFGRMVAPKLLVLGPKINLKGLTINGHDVDRALLNGLERAVWDSIARFVTVRLTDSVIEAATLRLPEPWRALRPGELQRILRARRDGIPAAAATYYARLAQVVDVHATDVRDVARVRREPGGALSISLHDGRKEPTKADPWFSRRFLPRETREIRIYLHGGDDSLAVEGPAGSPIMLRVVGGLGKNSAGGAEGVRLYDFDAEPKGLTYQADTLFDRRPWEVHGGDTLHPPRDYGSAMVPALRLRYASDFSLLTGVTVNLDRLGFRTSPYARRLTLGFDYATGPSDARFDLGLDLRGEGGGPHPVFRAHASGLELLRYYGQGNETARPGDGEFFRLEHTRYGGELLLARDLGRHGAIELGPALEYARTPLDPARFIGQDAPYGSGDFGMLGARAHLRLSHGDDKEDVPGGVSVELSGSAWPAWWDAAGSFGDIEGRVVTHLSAEVPLRPVLALRAGGRKVFGDYPYFASAFLGGTRSLRGYDEQRFAGNAMVFGNAELRLAVLPVPFFMGGHLGVHGLADVGRVWAEGETSDEWHEAFGGGLWYGVDARSMLISVTLADGPERTGVYVEAGFAF